MRELLITLIPLLCQVESNNNARAIGDSGRAVGILQIHLSVLKDIERIYGITYRPEERFNPKISRMICYKYLLHWGRHYERKTGKRVTKEVLCKIWNGGPFGYRKPGAEMYWQKVKDLM